MDNTLAKSAFIEAYQKTFGNVSYACRAVNIARSTYYMWLDSDADFKKNIADVEPRETLIDAAELQLAKKVNEGDTVAILFTLKTLGKKRGYIEKEVEKPSEQDSIQPPPITYNVVDMSVKKDGI